MANRTKNGAVLY